ncbi:MAG: hypothetical protein ACOC2W_02745 [bacterium]
METIINTVHEEEYSDKSRVLGVLINMSVNSKDNNYKESYTYIYRDGMYVIFNTIVDMVEYLLYGDNKMKRAYMSEKDFDILFDSKPINGKFSDYLKWTEGE